MTLPYHYVDKTYSPLVPGPRVILSCQLDSSGYTQLRFFHVQFKKNWIILHFSLYLEADMSIRGCISVSVDLVIILNNH